VTFAYLQNESTCAKVHSSKKGKEKCHHEDDIPPELGPDMKWQIDCLHKLKEHLTCNKHSSPGKRTFCLIRRLGENTSGGHKEMSHKDMTLWAKHIVSSVKSSKSNKKLTYFSSHSGR